MDRYNVKVHKYLKNGIFEPKKKNNRKVKTSDSNLNSHIFDQGLVGSHRYLHVIKESESQVGNRWFLSLPEQTTLPPAR